MSRQRAPLADRMRPRSLEEIEGQEQLLGPDGPVRAMLASGELQSAILWGPPGSGKTTIARAFAEAAGAVLELISAAGGRVKEVREAIARAEERPGPTLLFIDEIHRFSKSQQDALLGPVERGAVTLLGATTENPGFEVNRALRSRAPVWALRPLSEEALGRIIDRALADRERGLGGFGLELAPKARRGLVERAQGDARRALGALEAAGRIAWARERRRLGPGAEIERVEIGEAEIARALGEGIALYDKRGDEHYALASALIKSLRGSDPDAALYYAHRMLGAGADPKFVLRRLVIFAAEDIGLADPSALVFASAALTAFTQIGMPEGAIPISEAIVYLASAPKSNAAYRAMHAAQRAVREHPSARPPSHILNAPTEVHAQAGLGQGYAYPHDYEGHHVAARYLPEALGEARFYEPSDQGAEAQVAVRLKAWRGAAEGE